MAGVVAEDKLRHSLFEFTFSEFIVIEGQGSSQGSLFLAGVMIPIFEPILPKIGSLFQPYNRSNLSTHSVLAKMAMDLLYFG